MLVVFGILLSFVTSSFAQGTGLSPVNDTTKDKTADLSSKTKSKSKKKKLKSSKKINKTSKDSNGAKDSK